MVGLASSQVLCWLEELLLIGLVQWFELGQASCGLLLTGPLLVLGHINLIFLQPRDYIDCNLDASIEVQPGYTAGVNTAFYLSNNELYPGNHDEIDMELLGTVPGEPYTLQTNVYVRGTGDGARLVGREMRFHLWFDPAADFHHYAILWNPDEIVFLVDDVPIRRYERKTTTTTFPDREMWAYGSIWDASDWATDGGRYRADYRYQPLVAR
ncbi:putative xyloglucan endotransglucosylase/hydrolase protein 32 [Panicum miliaceum]|uniref:Xyloglucan endotransglucosylase/hydrolase protein 32 n=1 Tax=Panicum miliaceum TaxID=4540 RepID=A0A3L6SHQ0_PANMI|nr:putative xyloglucan endotransglucosylase/hydrolase protein 32 [Panicum miliaceum]